MIEQWVLFPLSVLFGFVSMSFGIGVAAMFIPFLILLYNVPFSAAIAITLIIEILGFSAALYSYIRKKMISYSIGVQSLFCTVPAAIVGVILSTKLTFVSLIVIFSLTQIIIAILIFHPEHEVLYRRDDPQRGVIRREFGLARDTTLVSGTFSGLLAGMTSTGIGEINNYVFLKKYHMSGERAAATSIFIIAITAFVAASAHLANIVFMHPEYLSSVGGLLVYGAAGVLLGIFITHHFSWRIPEGMRQRYVAMIFLSLGILSLLMVLV